MSYDTRPALTLQGVTKQYKEFCLDRLTLELPGGCIMGLIGENGAGKSTTMKILMGMVRPDAGEITILDKPLEELCTLKEDLGVVIDGCGLPEALTAMQLNKIFAGIYSRWNEERFFELCKLLEIPLKRKVKEFSRGMKMKLEIALAMSHEPRLLIWDEATNGLDPVARDQVLDLLAEFARDEDHAVLLSSHIVSDLEKICDYIAFVHKGRLMLCEDRDTLLETYGLLQCSSEDADALDSAAVIGRKDGRYHAQLLVRRDLLPEGMKAAPIDLEDLFVFMVKEAEK